MTYKTTSIICACYRGTVLTIGHSNAIVATTDNAASKIGGYNFTFIDAISTESMKALQTFLINESANLYYGCYPERPKQLFEGACIALSIILCQKQSDNSKDSCNLFGSGVLRCAESFRNNLFHSIEYISIQKSSFLSNYMLFPKYRKEIEQCIFSKLAVNNSINRFIVPQSNNIISYRTAGGRYWKIFLNREFGVSGFFRLVKLTYQE